MPNREDLHRILIIGSGPIVIGQACEFDYCCVHAAFALRELGYETIMVNSNPETVSTDYDTSDRLYFEPLTLEDVIEIARAEDPLGAIVQFGGQTPLKLALPLEATGVKILGTQPAKIHLAEERGAFNSLLRELGLKQPAGGASGSVEEAVALAARLGYPVLVRPSYVLGGRAMAIVYSDEEIAELAREAFAASPSAPLGGERCPVLVDKFLEDAIEVDVDAISDGKRTLIGGVMEHVEEAGVHYGADVVHERHRHRYEFNNDYRERFEKAGMRFSGLSPDGGLVEMIELTGHPWFVATQAHPEFKSRPVAPHPLFLAFVEAAAGAAK